MARWARGELYGVVALRANGMARRPKGEPYEAVAQGRFVRHGRLKSGGFGMNLNHGGYKCQHCNHESEYLSLFAVLNLIGPLRETGG